MEQAHSLEALLSSERQKLQELETEILRLKAELRAQGKLLTKEKEKEKSRLEKIALLEEQVRSQKNSAQTIRDLEKKNRQLLHEDRVWNSEKEELKKCVESFSREKDSWTGLSGELLKRLSIILFPRRR